jgi:hypothetical protein
MVKNLTFKMQQSPPPSSADAWVSGDQPVERQVAAPQPATNGEAMKRFTIDVPRALHTRIKIECARRGIKMADMMRELLERQFP